MARLIANLIAWGILFLSLGTLAEITSQVMHLAAKEHQIGLIRIQSLNRSLTK